MAKNHKKGASVENKANKRTSGNNMSDPLAAEGMKSSKDIQKSDTKKSKHTNDFTKENKNNSKNTGSRHISNKKFINPYTFVPISNKEPQRVKFEDLDWENSDKLDGCIECTLETKSSVFVPNTTRTFEYGFNEFFSYDDLSGMNKEDIPKENPKYPRIPGSEIKGMIRNIYEQLTDSCLSVIDNKNVPIKRSAKPKKAGVWDRETDKLYKAERKAIGKDELNKLFHDVNKQSDKISITGTKVFVKCNAKNYVKYCSLQDFEGAQRGFALKGEYFQKKLNESIIVSDLVNEEFTLTQQDKDRFQAVLERYDKKTKYGNEYDDYKKAYDSNIRYLPVFYEKVEDKLYLAPAMMTKEVFENTISKILENNHFKHHACNSNTGFCPACRLFGTIADKKSLASRLRFTDTEVFKNAKFDVPRFIPVLGTPKYSSTEFYLKKPIDDSKAAMWNYDYYTVNKEGDKGIEKLVKYEAELKGRKVYWQGADKLKNERNLDEQKLFEKGNQSKTGKNNIKIRSAGRALMPGAKTKFKVYFEDISEEELAALLYSLTLGNDCNHRIGRGKPYGMGVVKVNIEKLNLRTYSFEDGKLSITENEADPKIYKIKDLWEVNKMYIELYSIPLSEGEEKLVEYPTPPDGKEIFKWFANNRGSVQAPKIAQCLPEITADYKHLFKKYKNATS